MKPSEFQKAQFSTCSIHFCRHEESACPQTWFCCTRLDCCTGNTSLLLLLLLCLLWAGNKGNQRTPHPREHRVYLTTKGLGVIQYLASVKDARQASYIGNSLPCQVKQHTTYKCFRGGLSDLVHATAAAYICEKNSFQMSWPSDLWQYLPWPNSLDVNHIIFLLSLPHWYPLENMSSFYELGQSWQISSFPFSSSTPIS